MRRDEIWAAVHAERSALAADLASVDDAGWSAATPCEGWTVRDVLAHMVASAVMSPPVFLARLARSGFSLTALQAKDVARLGEGGGAATLARFKAVAASTTHPPGPTPTWLGETIVHAADIRHALGIAHDYPVGAVVAVADSYRRSNLVLGAKRRVEGLTLAATDTDWTSGAGPEVSGPVLALLLAMTGRKVACDALSGPGVETLRLRP